MKCGAVEESCSNDRPMGQKTILGGRTRPNEFGRATLCGEFGLFQQGRCPECNQQKDDAAGICSFCGANFFGIGRGMLNSP